MTSNYINIPASDVNVACPDPDNFLPWVLLNYGSLAPKVS